MAASSLDATKWTLDSSWGLLLHALIKRLKCHHACFCLGTIGLFVVVIPSRVIALRAWLNDNTVPSRKHIERAVADAVIDALLRDEPCDLPANWNDRLILPELPRRVACAVDDHALRQSTQLCW